MKSNGAPSSKQWRGYFLLSQGLVWLQSFPTVDSSWSFRSPDFVLLYKKSNNSTAPVNPQQYNTLHPPMRRSRKLHDLGSIKLSGEISKLASSISHSLLFLCTSFLLQSQRRLCPEAMSVLIFVILLAAEQWFSLGRAFLIIDTLWYGEGLASASAFWLFCTGSWATPGCIHGNGHHNELWFRHQPVWQRVCGDACARRAT